MRMLTSGLQTETARDRRRELPRRERDLLHDEREDARDCERVSLPAREHGAEAVVAEDLDGRLAERGGEPVEDAGTRRRRDPALRTMDPLFPITRSTAAMAPNTRTASAHSFAGALSLPSAASPMTMKAASPSTTTTAPPISRAVDRLAREEVAEREREHDRRHEQRLDHREPAVGEGDGLERVAAEERDRPGEPPLLARELQE